jgi:hypothetical protein
MRHLAADWDIARIRRVLLVSVVVAVVVTLLGVHDYGALAAAVGVLAGALVEHAQALGSALRPAGTPGQDERPPAR